jgi:hypothetical protein
MSARTALSAAGSFAAKLQGIVVLPFLASARLMNRADASCLHGASVVSWGCV